MIRKKRTKVTDKQKEGIILALLDPQSDLNELARKYKLARSTLIKWRRQHKREEVVEVSGPSFVEVKLDSTRIVSSLKKVDLKFANYKCSVEGDLSSAQLLKLVELLEGGSMLNPDSSCRIYLCTGHTDMRKGINGLSILAQRIISDSLSTGALFIFRGKRADKIKIVWWDGQGFCLYYKCLDSGKFTWPKLGEQRSLAITRAQLSMLIEAIDWRNPSRFDCPRYVG